MWENTILKFYKRLEKLNWITTKPEIKLNRWFLSSNAVYKKKME